ncbi:unnamed protein product [Allacma fusca]|uniref:Uncharacterized protein n=1 Tax=Allacma fusca TaxID=39272 RepID=A0A8J2JRT2_9HEXA|nr:unnamed protein product [Allacma fusca]
MWGKFRKTFAPIIFFQILLVKLCSTQETICKFGGNGHFGPKSCCNEIPFLLGHSNNPQAVKDCMVEPAEPTLSFVDSYWEHYACIVNKTLGTESFTGGSYVKMMVQNLPGSVQAEVVNHFEANLKDDPALSTIQRLKLFWRIYFDADFFVCGRASRAKGTFKNSDRKFWEPSFMCAGEAIPAVSMVSAVDFDKFITELNKCENRLRQMINSEKEVARWEASIDDACEFVVDEEIKFEDLMNSTLDFGNLYKIHDTTVIWSKNVKEVMLKGFKERLLEIGFKEEEGFPFRNFEMNVLKIIPLGKYQERQTEMRQFYINSQALTFMLDMLHEVREKKICGVR